MGMGFLGFGATRLNRRVLFMAAESDQTQNSLIGKSPVNSSKVQAFSSSILAGLFIFFFFLI